MNRSIRLASRFFLLPMFAAALGPQAHPARADNGAADADASSLQQQTSSDELDAAAATKTPIDMEQYNAIMADRVASPAELADWFHAQQFQWWPLVPPDPDFTLRQPNGLVPFNWQKFPDAFNSSLSPRDLNSVPAYRVILAEDPLTRNLVAYDEAGKPILSIPPEPGYDGTEYALTYVPDLNSGRYGPVSRDYYLRLYDPARLQFETTLMPMESVPYYLYAQRQIEETAARMAVKQGPGMMKAYTGAPVTSLWFSAIEPLSGGVIRLTLVYPWDGDNYPDNSFTSRVDFLAARDILDPWCDVLATTNVNASTNWIEWTDYSATNAGSSPRFYWAGNVDQDTDGDGFSDAQEVLRFHSDPADSNSKPVSVSGTVTYGGPETGFPIRVLAVTASNSWAVGRSATLQAPGSYTNERVATLLDYWFKAFVDVNSSFTKEDWEPSGEYSSSSAYVTSSLTGIDIAISDVPSVWVTVSYTGQLALGTVHVLLTTSSNDWASAYAASNVWQGTSYVDPWTGQTNDGSVFPSNFVVIGMPPSNYYVKAFLDLNGDGALTAPEPAGYWTNNPAATTCRVANVNILLDRDSDGDGLPDWWELQYFRGITNALPAVDSDSDGLNNLQEYQIGSDPTNADTDGDGMSDYWEYQHFGNATSALPTDDADGDGYLNIYECLHGGDPTNAAVVPGATRYVSPNGTPANGFTNWTCAATNIQAALNVATGMYEIVLVADGTYLGTSNKNLTFPTNPVTLISVSGADACVIDCQTNGRGIHFQGTDDRYTVVAGLTIQNGSTNKGGGIYCASAAPSILKCVIASNAASGDGGGILCTGSTANAWIESCTFRSNRAGDDGGGMAAKDAASPILRICTIQANSAGGKGGGIRSSSAEAAPRFEGCIISGNFATNDGGGISIKQSSALVSNCLIQGNSTLDNGGGMMIEEGSAASVIGCTNSANRAQDHGGGFYVQDSSPTIQLCRLEANIAVDGGGIGYHDAGGLLDRCEIRGNTAYGDGGGVRCKAETGSCSPLIRNCLIAGNATHMSGGGVECKSGNASPWIESCTIVANSAMGSGGGIYAFKAFPTNQNCIYWGNSPDQIASSTGTVDSTWCVIEAWTGGGDGNSSNDPALVPGSYRLTTNSVCIDAGISNAVACDWEGEVRADSQWRTNATSIWDIGRDEFVDANSNGMADAWEIEHFGALTNAAVDSDEDGLTNWQEYAQGTDPLVQDTDGDGLSDGDEVHIWQTSPILVDTDGDGIPDGWEVLNGLSPTSAADAGADTDGDGVINLIEWIAGTSPTNAASPTTNDIVQVELAVGEPTNSVSASERYGMKINGGLILTNAAGAFGTITNAYFNFVKGFAYTVTVDHIEHDVTWPNGWDFDYYAKVDGQGIRTAGNANDLSGDTWFTNAAKGLLIHDPVEILGVFYTDGATSKFYASSNSAVMYVLKVDIVQSNATGIARAGTNLYFNLTGDSWTNCTWKIEPDLGTNGARFATSSTNDGSTNTWSGTNAWIDPGNTVTDYVIRAYANELTNCFDTADLNVLSGKVYIAFGYLETNSTDQIADEDTALNNLATLVSNLTVKGYAVCEERKCTTTAFENMLDDPQTMGIIWFSHGGVVCQPDNTNCQREVSLVASWATGGLGDKLWVTNWSVRLSNKKLCALWILSCGTAPSDFFHLSCPTNCTHCGSNLCPTHSPSNPGPLACNWCSNAYLDGGSTNFHSATNLPTVLVTFSSEQSDLVRSGGHLKAYSYAFLPDPSNPPSGSEAVNSDQSAFETALP